jgi:hypothetical protein
LYKKLLEKEILMKRLMTLLTVIVVLSMTVIPVLAGEPDPGMGNTNFTIMNLDASEMAEISVDYVAGAGMQDPEGTVDLTWVATATARGSTSFAATAAQDKGLPDNWKGSVVASANRPIAAFAQMTWRNNTLDASHARFQTAGAYNGFTEGSGTLYLPSLAQRDGSQYSIIAVQSAAAASASANAIPFTITFFDRSGNQSGQITSSVKPGAQKTFNLSEYSDDPDVVPDLDAANDTNNWLGAAIIEATNAGDLLAASSTMHWANYSAAYSAIPSGASTIYLPSGTRRNNLTDTGEGAASNWLQYTAVVVQNLGAQATNVTVKWLDRTGNTLASFVDPIPANSAHGYNTRFVTNSDIPEASKASFAELMTNDWNGSVVIESDGANIVAVANLQWGPAHPSAANTASAYTAATEGYDTLFVPQNFRRNNAATPVSWIQYTGLIVQNVGTADCNNFTVSWKDRDTGEEKLTFNDSLAPGIAHGYNTNVGGDIPDPDGDGPDTNKTQAAKLGDNFYGAVTISGAAGCQLAGIHNTVWPAFTAGTTYNAFGPPTQ